MKTQAQIFDFIGKQKVAIISSVDANGFPNMKAMLAPRKIEGNQFYFTTNTSSIRVKQYTENSNASVYFFHKGIIKYQGVLFIGSMQVLTDEASKQMIWKAGDTRYYKKGVGDPDYCVLRFTATQGRYYCNLKTCSFEL